MSILSEIGLNVSVREENEVNITVRFSLANEPVTFLGHEFKARATTLGHVSWVEASAGHLPAAVLGLVDESRADELKSAVFDVVLSEMNKQIEAPASSPSLSL